MEHLDNMDLQACIRRLPRSLKDMMMRVEGTPVVVAGGYIRSIVGGEEIHDIDVFAGDENASQNLALQLPFDGRLHTTSNAITAKIADLSYPVQFIYRWVFDNPEDIARSFDFTVCQSALWYVVEQKKWTSICSPRFYQDLAAKRLVYTSPVRNEDAGGSLLRVLKYYQRGYRIPLDSFGAVLARLFMAYRPKEKDNTEVNASKILRGLLIEVDPNGIVDHRAYLPAQEEEK